MCDGLASIIRDGVKRCVLSYSPLDTNDLLEHFNRPCLAQLHVVNPFFLRATMTTATPLRILTHLVGNCLTRVKEPKGCSFLIAT